MKRLTISTNVIATAAAADNAAIAIWNTNDAPIAVLKIVGYINCQGQTDDIPVKIQRTTTRGTQGTTKAVHASNLHASDRATFTLTGINLDSNYSAQPTFETGRLGEGLAMLDTIPVIEFDYECDPIWIAKNQGLAIVSDSAIGVYASRWAFHVEV